MTEAIFSVDEEDFIGNEEFNFDLPVSPVDKHSKNKSKKEKTLELQAEEDEVFFGPVGFMETCVAKKTELSSNSSDDCKPLSPLTTEQYLEIFKEANSIAMAFQEHAQHDNNKKDEQIQGIGKSGKTDRQVEHLSDSMLKLALKPHSQATITRNKNEVQQFKRAVKKDMRSPRRTTYTISVSPANQPPPSHLPTAEECVLSLGKNKPRQIKFTAESVPEDSKKRKPASCALTKKSRLPAKRTGIPKTSGLRKPAAALQHIALKKMSPPKRTRLNSGERTEGICVPTSPTFSDVSDTSSIDNMPCSGKTTLPGNNNPIKNGRWLKKPGSNLQAPAKNSDATKNWAKKLPVSKVGIVKPGVIQRKTLAVVRPSKLARSGGVPGNSNVNCKPQPIKATYGLKVAAKGPSKKFTPPNTKKIAGKLANSRMRTPCTPVFQDIAPKRILSSSSQSACKLATPRTTRALSADSAIKPNNPQMRTLQRKKPSLPGTPQRSSETVVPPVMGYSRRRSGIPTPMRHSVSSSVSRLSSTSSIQSLPSPRTLPVGSRKSRIPISPIETPPPPKVSPALPSEGARLDNNGASPVLSSPPVCQEQIQRINNRHALTEIQEKIAFSPKIDMLIKLDTPGPCPKLKVGSLLDLDVAESVGLRKKCLTPLIASTAKENLIDLL